MPLPSVADGRYYVTLEDVVEATALGDYRSNNSAIRLAMLQEVLKIEPSLPEENLNAPISLSAAMESTKSNPTNLSACRTTQLPIKIMLPGSNLPVHTRGVKFHVVDQEIDEALLGRPFLCAIGFDLEKHLESVAPMIDGMHSDDLSMSMLKRVSVRYSSLVYQNTDDDPVQLLDTVGACMLEVGSTLSSFTIRNDSQEA